MNNIEKKLDALIGALGFDVEEVMGDVFVGCYSGRDIHNKQVINYRLTKRQPRRVVCCDCNGTGLFSKDSKCLVCEGIGGHHE